MTTLTKKQRKHANRVASLVRRAVILKRQIIAKSEKRRELIKTAISAGLMPDQVVEVEIADKKSGIITKEPFVLVDNYKEEKTGGWATVNRFDLKEATQKQVKAATSGGENFHG